MKKFMDKKPPPDLASHAGPLYSVKQQATVISADRLCLRNGRGKEREGGGRRGKRVSLETIKTGRERKGFMSMQCVCMIVTRLPPGTLSL